MTPVAKADQGNVPSRLLASELASNPSDIQMLKQAVATLKLFACRGSHQRALRRLSWLS